MLSKKGQKEGTAIAVVLIIIAFFMVLYILFIPPEERNKILEGNNNNELDSTNNLLSRIELLAQSPGVVSPATDLGQIHPIPSISLFVRTEPSIEQLAQNLIIKKGLFSSSNPKLKFPSEDVENTKRVTLNFYVNDAKSGELRIKLNGRTIYSEELSKGAQIVDINKNLIKENNELEFIASHPGIAFWSTNKFELKNVILKQEFERTNTQETRQFTITKAEKQTLSKLNLKYTQVCNKLLNEGTALLDISVNGRRAESLRIFCITTDQEIEIDPNLIIAGQNTLRLSLEEGDFSFNQISLNTQTSESKFPTYQFSIPAKEFDKLKLGDKKAVLEVYFAQDNKQKNARIDINNNEILINTADNFFSRDVSDLIVDGTNFVRLIPSTTFTITNLKIVLGE
ncbi:hypothetical protein J4440_06905 [Candidatus Woesearchaeota archaeon]|nr:hypothetical protein [Candidatus Woesearchaeota archaeon]